MALHSSTLAWKIPWTEEHGRLQGSQSFIAQGQGESVSGFVGHKVM